MPHRIQRMRPSDDHVPTLTVQEFAKSPQRVSEVIREAILNCTMCGQCFIQTPTFTKLKINWVFHMSLLKPNHENAKIPS